MSDRHDNYADIPRLIGRGVYNVQVGLGYLERHLAEWEAYPGGLDLDPDFQRGHVWNVQQQIRFVEFALRGGLESSSGTLLFNCADWDGNSEEPIQIVDGKQRLTAVLRFLRDEIPAFRTYRSDFTGSLSLTNARFEVHVNKLRTREEVLQWYLELNSGGVVHSYEELDRVRKLLDEEKAAGPRP